MCLATAHPHAHTLASIPPATYYTCFEALLDHYEVDQLAAVQQAGMGDIINPLLAGASTGLLYKSAGERRDVGLLIFRSASRTRMPPLGL